MVQLWILLALAYALGHALVSIFDKMLLKNKTIEPMSLSTFRLGTNALMSLIIVLVLFDFVFPSSASFWINLAFVSFIYALGALMYFIPLKFGDVSQLIPFREAITILLSFFLAILLLSERTTVQDFIGTLVIMVGVYILLTGGKIVFPKFSKSIVFIGISGMLIAAFSVMFKPLVALAHPSLANLYLYVFVFLLLLAFNLLVKPRNQLRTFELILKDKRVLLFSLAASLSATLGTLALFYGLSIGNATEVLPVARALPVFAALIGWVTLKEKAGFTRLIATVIIFGGVYLISI